MTFRPPTVAAICDQVCDYFDVTPEDLMGPRRFRMHVQARRVAWWLCRDLRRMGLIQIGRRFNYDHTTVLYGLKQLELDPLLKQQAEELRDSLTNGKGTQ